MKTISVKIEENIINDIKKICDIYNISFSDFIRNTLEKEVNEKKNDFMYRMNNVPFCDENEEKEIIEALNKLFDDDLKIAKVERIKL